MDLTSSVIGSKCNCFGLCWGSNTNAEEKQKELNGKVSLWSLKYFKSNLAVFAYSSSLLAASVAALHYAPALLGIAALPPLALTAITVVSVVAVALGVALFRQRLLYDISLISTVYNQ